MVNIFFSFLPTLFEQIAKYYADKKHTIFNCLGLSRHNNICFYRTVRSTIVLDAMQKGGGDIGNHALTQFDVRFAQNMFANAKDALN